MPTHLPQNQFITSAAFVPAAVEAAVSKPLIALSETAVPNSTLDPATGVEAAAAPDLTDPPVAAAELFDEPSSNEGRPQEAPAGSTPNTVTLAGALGTNHIGEIFHWVRKLMKDDVGFVLDEAAFMADVEEIPLFIRDGEHLRRQA